jgi:tetratricopeptide (TPR) repeat protein
VPAHSAIQTVAGCGAIVALVAGAAGLQWVRDRDRSVTAVAESTLYVTSGNMLKRLTIGYTALAADLYWIRALQYYGGTKIRLSRAVPPTGAGGVQRVGQVTPGDSTTEPDGIRVHNAYELLYPMLDLTTTLDPLFNVAYRFGSIFLAEPFPGGAGRPDLAIALLEKGLQAKPDKWEYMQDVGFVNYWWRQDYRAAADWFDRASKVPGAPWWLQSLAASTLADGGDRHSSRVMWRAIRESAEIDWLKNDADRRLTQFDALDQIDQLQLLVDQASAGAGATVTDWTTLLRRRALPGLPLDPSGTPYEIDANGRVKVAPTSPLMPMPQEPRRIGPSS